MRGCLVFLFLVLVFVPAATVPAGAATTPDLWASEYAGGTNAAYNPGEHTITPANASRLAAVWQQRVSIGQFAAPAIVGGTVYHVINPGSALASSTFVASSVRTGQTLWSISLAAGSSYFRGLTVYGTQAVLPYEGWHKAAGITLIDLRARKVLYNRSEPPPAVASWGDSSAGPIDVDSRLIYMSGGSNPLNVFRLSDGAALWHLTDNNVPVRGVAAANGIVYVGGDAGVVAYAGATGKKLWTAPGWGSPIVSGGRVISANPNEIFADSATGCGAPTCKALWVHRNASVALGDTISLGGADGATLYDSYTDRAPDGQAVGHLQRLSLVSGQLLWQAVTGNAAESPVRAGSVVWVVANGNLLEGFSATQVSGRPLVTVTEDANDGQGGIPQGTAVANGTVVVQVWPNTLLGYRVPGT